jgi:hypothetical protein
MPRTAPRRATFRPCLERLEDRTTPSTTALSAAPNPGITAQPVTLTAVVTASGSDQVRPGTGNVTRGSVQFLDGATPLGRSTSRHRPRTPRRAARN